MVLSAGQKGVVLILSVPLFGTRPSWKCSEACPGNLVSIFPPEPVGGEGVCLCDRGPLDRLDANPVE